VLVTAESASRTAQSSIMPWRPPHRDRHTP
jgi:hypothetical protein